MPGRCTTAVDTVLEFASQYKAHTVASSGSVSHGLSRGYVNGEVFEDTRDRKKPIVFLYGSRPFTAGLCLGVEKGLQGMKAGLSLQQTLLLMKSLLCLVIMPIFHFFWLPLHINSNNFNIARSENSILENAY